MLDDRIIIPYSPRSLQWEIHERGPYGTDPAKRKPYRVLVTHRRFGKTVLGLNELIQGALRCENDLGMFAFIAPTYKQAKRLVWKYLLKYTAPIPDMKYNVSELSAEFPNGNMLYLLGADSPDSLRGTYLDGVQLDEIAQIPPGTWEEIIQPQLFDRDGWALFTGTPQGDDHFHKLFLDAQEEMTKPDGEWWAAMYKASETKILDQKKLDKARELNGEEIYNREYECSFASPLPGTYWATQLKEIEDAGQMLMKIEPNPVLKVHTAWDIGVNDSMAIWFFQKNGPAVSIIDFFQASGKGLDYYLGTTLPEKKYDYGTHLGPWDMGHRSKADAVTLEDFAKDKGYQFTVLDKISVEVGINAVRRILPNCWFSARHCQIGLKCLKHYRGDWLEKRGTLSKAPRHDWSSNAADAFRTLALGLDKVTDGANMVMTPDQIRAMQAQHRTARPHAAISVYSR